MGTRAPARRFSSYRVLRHRDFTLVSGGNFISQLGTWSQYVGIGWAARQSTDSTFLVSIAFASQFAPSLLLSSVAGVAADRFDRRALVIVGNLVMMIPPIVVGLLLRNGPISIGALVALILVGGSAQAFTQPAAMALIPSLVPPDELSAAIPINTGVVSLTRVMGPGLGAAAIKAWGISWGFYLNAVSFLAVVIACLAMRARPPRNAVTTEPFVLRLRKGMQYARANPTVGRLLALTLVATFFTVQAALMPSYVKDVLHAGVSTYAVISSTPGFGAVAGAIIAGEIRTDRARRMVIITSAVFISGALLTLALTNASWLAITVMAGFGFGYFLQSTLISTMLMQASVDEYRGRIMGLYGTASIGMIPINSLLAGFIAEHVGIQRTIGVCGAAIVVFTVWFVASGNLKYVNTTEPVAVGAA
ncbi:MAG: MFS transporter [Acidimicrobiia bacterium]